MVPHIIYESVAALTACLREQKSKGKFGWKKFSLTGKSNWISIQAVQPGLVRTG